MVAVLGLLSFSSCKKDYVCLCTWTEDGYPATETETYTQVTQGDAKAACDTKQADILNYNSGVTNLDCKAK